MANSNPQTIIPLIRALSESYQVLLAFSNIHIRTLGLTSSQFDIIATLGNTQGMTCKQLGDETLITKGTLTGVLDRLEKKLLLERQATADKRCWLVKLTPKGEKLFTKIFPEHIAYLANEINNIPVSERKQLVGLLEHFTQVIKSKL